MNKRSILFWLALSLTAVLSGCGGGDGGGGSSGSSGTISMNVTDAKPVLPTTGVVESVTITFDEVSVHKSGGGWTPLRVATYPRSYTIDLYQFSNGNKTQFVPPVPLDSGKYTQVRIGVTSGTIRIDGQDHQLEIPSTNLKTDKNFEFDVPEGRAVDLTVDFDLSRSIVLTGTGTYQLKPVLHINQTSQAATIQGTINFGPTATQATVTVTWDKNPNEIPNPLDPNTDEVYTAILVNNTDPSFKIYWLVPNQGYFVKVQLPGRTYDEYVAPDDLEPGEIFTLNKGSSI